MTKIDELTKVFEKGNVKVVVEWYHDEDCDINHYGKYTSADHDFVIDRQTGELLGEYLPEPDPEDYLPDDKPSWEITDDEWNEADRKADEAWDEWNEAPREVLADGLSTMNWHEYRYFIPERLRDFQGDWKHDETANVHWEINRNKMRKYSIDTGDKQLDLSTFWSCQDYERVERLNRGDWSYIGCVAKVLVDEIEIGYDSLRGIESDSDKEYLEETERETVTRAFENILMMGELELREVIESLEN